MTCLFLFCHQLHIPSILFVSKGLEATIWLYYIRICCEGVASPDHSEWFPCVLLKHICVTNSTVGGRQGHRKSTLDNRRENAYEGMLEILFLHNMAVQFTSICAILLLKSIWQLGMYLLSAVRATYYLDWLQDDVDKLLTSQLGPRERDIVRLHYGVGREDGSVMSLESISYRCVLHFRTLAAYFHFHPVG